MKEILGAIEFSDVEVRLIIGEFFKTRFNIIAIETEPCHGISEFMINSKEARDEVKEAVKTVIDRAHEHLHAAVERLIIIVPPVGFKRYPLKVNVRCTGGIVTKDDVNRSLKKAMRTNIDNNITIVNAVCVKYTCNGISSRRLPENEVTNELIVDIDLLCADKTIVFDYVSLIEECGIEVLDISLDMYAICKEAVLFEQTVNQNLILIKSDYQTTSLALLSKGKLFNVEILYEGLMNIYDVVSKRFGLQFSHIDRLVKYNAKMHKDEYSDDVIFAWNDADGKSNTISESDLSSVVKDEITKLAVNIRSACEPILANGLVQIVMVGEGAKMDSLVSEIQRTSGVSVKTYSPETIGARDTKYSALLGSIYGYRDANEFKERKISSIDLYELSESIEKRVDSEGESLTTKIKNLFQLKDKGGDNHE